MRMFKKHPKDDPTSIGNVFVRMGLIDKEVLGRAVAALNNSQDLMLGEILVQMGVIEEHQLELALAKQQALRGKLDHNAVIGVVDRAMDRQNSVFDGLAEIGAMAKAAAAKQGGK